MNKSVIPQSSGGPLKNNRRGHLNVPYGELPVPKITFILGGARSGKSSFAVELAKREKNRKVAFIATCQGLDKEMRQRIYIHKNSRPKKWDTFEEPLNLPELLKQLRNRYGIIIIDCLTLWASNMVLRKHKDSYIANEMEIILSLLKRNKSKSIILANEVGLGIVPDNKLVRRFRDIAGRINQIAAEKADRVFFMAAGLPSRLK